MSDLDSAQQLNFFAGWTSWFARAIACSLYATGFGSFATSLFHEISGRNISNKVSTTIAISALLASSGLNYRSARGVGQLEIVVTRLKVAVFLVVVAFGLSALFEKPDPLGEFVPFLPEGGLGFLGAMGLTFIAFEGYEIIAQTAEEVQRSSQTIPRAIFASIFIAVTIYILVAIILLGAVEAPAGESVYQYWGRPGELGLMESAGQFVVGGKSILLVAGLASTASALNATTYGSSRIAFAMGRDGELWSALAKVHPIHQTPYLAIIPTNFVVVIATLVMPICDIAAAADVMLLIAFAMVCATVIRLRKLWPDHNRPFRVPLSPWLPAIGIAAGFTLSLGLIHLSAPAWVATGR